MNLQKNNYRPEMTSAGIEASYPVTVMDEFGNKRETHITGERPLTIYVDKREIVTLMTLGKYPELLVIGYLHNQGFIKSSGEIKAVQVDWDIDSAVVITRNGIGGWEKRLEKRTVTSGCGQGTVFGDLMDNLDDIQLPIPTLYQSSFYRLLHNIREYNEVYKKSGAVHGCALCKGEKIEVFIEDVGRHNATDAIAGHMLLEGIDGTDKFIGFARSLMTTAATGVDWFPGAANDELNFDGTTTGGIVGTLVRITAVASAQYFVEAYIKSSGSQATPFAGS